MPKFITALYSHSTQAFLQTFGNHLLVVIAFFLPINQGAVKSGFFILIVLLLLQKNPFLLLKQAFSNRVIQGFIAIWLLHIIGISYADDPEIAARYTGEMNFFLYSLLIIIFAQYRFMYRLFGAFILGVFLCELLSYSFILEFITSPIPQIFDGFPSASKNEPTPFTYRLEYGYILAITSAFILIRFLQSEKKGEKIALGLFLAIITLNVFLNSARVGYILFFITNAVVIINYYKTTFFKQLIYLIPLGVAILSIAWMLSSNLQTRFHETTDSIEIMINDHNFNSSIGLRVDMAITGISAVVKNDHLWLGFGTGMQGKAVYEEAVDTNNTTLINFLPDRFYSGYKSILDCSYIDIFIQFGLIGIVMLLYLFTQIARFKQTDQILNTMKHAILWSAIFYAIVSSLFFGILTPTLIVVLLSFTLVQTDLKQLPLANITSKTVFFYTLSAVILFTLSKLT